MVAGRRQCLAKYGLTPPNGLDLVADEALEGPVRATCLRLVDRLQAPFGDSFGRLAPLLAGLTPPPIEVAEVTYVPPRLRQCRADWVLADEDRTNRLITFTPLRKGVLRAAGTGQTSSLRIPLFAPTLAFACAKTARAWHFTNDQLIRARSAPRGLILIRGRGLHPHRSAPNPSFPRRRESRGRGAQSQPPWMPACAGMT